MERWKGQECFSLATLYGYSVLGYGSRRVMACLLAGAFQGVLRNVASFGAT